MEKSKWLFALVQHPMVLLVHEDRGIPEVAERIPPWGAKEISGYAERVRRNLGAMKLHPGLKLNYEFSAIELKILAETSPDIIPIMRELILKKQLAFLGGDFSQPHSQLYSGELNYRQIEKGLEVFESLVGYKVTNNFHQETSLHDQLPQLLKAFGFSTVTPPTFAHTMIPLPTSQSQPHFVDSDYTGYLPIAGDSVALWRGLDGTEIPTVIAAVSTCGFYEDRVHVEAHKGLYRSSRILISAPDMEEIDIERLNFINARGETVLLDEAVQNEVRKHKPTWKLKLDTYWSYSEGQLAEAVYRKIREAESILLTEEAQTAILGEEKRAEFDTDLEIVLTAMHHDVNWIEVTDLKAKYIEKMSKVIKKSKEHISKLVRANLEIQENIKMIRVVNTLPYEREEIVRFTLDNMESIKLKDISGKEIVSLCIPSFERKNAIDVFFKVFVPALSSTDYLVEMGQGRFIEGEVCSQAVVKAGDSTYVVCSNGTISEAIINGENILSGPGHDLRYLAEDGTIIGGASRNGTMKHYKAPDIDVLRISAPVGDILVEIEYVASTVNKHLEITTQFHFNNNEVGLMWEDWTKLNSYWPVAGNRIRHDIPYGTIDGIDVVPLYAPSWISVQGEKGGLAVMNTGTPKHFVEDGVIGCVWAWGGRNFSNRMHMDWTDRARDNNWDLTLKGVQTIRSGAMAFSQSQSEADIARAAQCLNSPMLTFGLTDVSICNHTPKPTVDVSKTGLIVTSVMVKNNSIAYRFYEAEGKVHTVSDICKQIGYELNVEDLSGNILDEVTPYRIGYLIL